VKRREFVALLGGASAWPLAARAQAERMRRIGVLLADAENDPEPQGWMLVFRKRLQELGWTDDRDSEIVQRWAGGDPTRLEFLAAELAGLKLNVIFCRGTPAVAALQRATRAVPIVFINANDPVGSGFVASLARPGCQRSCRQRFRCELSATRR
jgi:putative tryptophan/tyrosine transport system substrate-binding protein